MKMTKKQSQGFTLVELMVVLVILGIVSIGAITAITGQSKVYHSEEDLIDMQMNAKIAMDRVCSLLRVAGVNCEGSFGNNLTSGNLVTFGDVAANPTTDLFVITNNASPTSDQLTLVGAVRHVEEVASVTSTQITLNSSDHDLNGSIAAKSYIVISPSANNRYKTITTASDNPLVLSTVDELDSMEVTEITNAVGATPPVTINVYQVQAFTIRLVDTTINGKTLRSLRIDDNVISTRTDMDVADNIQDIQFQYGIDNDSDPQIDSWVDNPGKIKQIKAVRVFILARTGKFDKDFTDLKTYNLAGDTFTGSDNFTDLNTSNHVHRYLLETTIAVRNRNF